ncbi:hypothetical protein G3R49_00410 [Shewanella sp. WXL01]|uniref:Uncharacterized protein n=1 Tax=Shewanella maritima TaxID=2520507 RepID=A0A411PGT0_9GAMM|nr:MULTISPECIES: hypothetical protein [Shewanella]NKF49037.1 hypothetical protein [Shewanella sp. WXL01]QBF82819.1 hypothetical protein EXU30_09030 [Shewanella maritima]
MKIVEFEVLNKHDEHCNLDSFPLRFGFSCKTDTWLKLYTTSEPQPSPHRPERLKYQGYILNPTTQEKCEGTFVVLQINEHLKFVTAWRNDQDTEHYLSEVMKNLRKDGVLTSEHLLTLHPKYIRGELSKHSDLVKDISHSRTEAEVEKIQSKTDRYVAELQKRYQEKNIALEAANKKLKQELADERAKAANQNSTVKEISPHTLIRVEENQNYRGSLCTVITLANGARWYMKTSTFDRAGNITKKAQSLINKPVVITSWDPVEQPGKWSSQGYFRNLFASA